ncbi:gliding motility-associated C-terminal domain-containing protein [Draconibacterium sp. IB214405]|uniref:T9SS type B sorting domain-containing protein n=1 Tax=Draconibacterium sp. IB214405 TaxID=3097352 RepID=UPI002A0BFAA1|nr:gliding motility-associated C-terminal domain-containing protein [Draconibacterium sp. IB214405]MDX8337957.1 gliding motility-associated C-terminal domain-containing protein [Draconibacterium sp. IB214405]
MSIKAFFIMIITLLAALCGAAQEDFVIYEGAEHNYFVDDHPGNSYSWKVLTGFLPDIEADPGDYTFTTAQTSKVGIRWNKAGLYYLNVIETDVEGSFNRKAVAITVLANTRSVAFANRSSSVCFNPDPNESRLLQLVENGGTELDPSRFPVTIKTEINGSEFIFQLNFDDQGIAMPDSFMVASPERDQEIELKILEAIDAKGQSIKPLDGNDVHLITVYAQPEISYIYADDSVDNQEAGFYELEMTQGNSAGAVYSWSVEPTNGTSTDLQAIGGSTANILWDGPEGTYTLYATATDGNGCVAETISKEVEVATIHPKEISVYAGPDTLIGGCQPYLFSTVYPTENTYTYQWEPTTGLDNPTIANPVFTPGETTSYILTVTTSQGKAYSDTLTINVSELVADAGEDFMLEYESTALLNGSGSFGEQIEYSWTTENGNFVAGAQTATPEIDGPGTYVLTITDSYGCTSIDSVVVSRLITAPIARDDYDTTEYKTSVTIDLLANDEDQQGDLDQASLQILQDPANGYVDLNGDGTVTYTPNDGFLGGDVFQYRICNYYEKCDNANVFVYVTAADFFIPEAFTPNGDNVNDYFEIKGIELFEQNSITIINRWGKKVYKAHGYGVSTSPQFWDGKSNQGGGNNDLPTGTYFYVLDLGNGEQPIAGSVYIDR